MTLVLLMSGSDNSLCGRKKGHHVQWRLFRSIPDLCPQIIVVYLAVFIIRNDCRQCEVSVCVCVLHWGAGSSSKLQWLTTGHEVCPGKGTATVTAMWSQSENKRRSVFCLVASLSHLFFFSTCQLSHLSKLSVFPATSVIWSLGREHNDNATKKLSPLQGCSRETLKVKTVLFRRG